MGLSLDLKPTTTTTSTTYRPQSISIFLKEVSMIGNVSEKLSKVDGYVKCLKQEMDKIGGLKNELPLCMLLLDDAIDVLKCETMRLKENENDLRDKKSWMSSVQLGISDEKHKSVQEIAKEDDRSENIFPRNGGGAFVPFKGFLPRKEEKKKETEIQLEPALSLLTPGIKKLRAEPTPPSFLVSSKSGGAGGGGRAISPPSTENTQSGLQTPLQSQGLRKPRRCWSPDLHRQFLNALQQLGGSQVATPKQIRELMKVDGLTNDEVKSHLQKYRLHSRRYPAGASASASANANTPTPENQKLSLFAGLWVPQDQCGTSNASASQSESPQGPLQLVGTSGGTSVSSGDSMDDEEDGKSESYNWKGHFYKPGEVDA